jgi:hypothetical protein
MAVLIENVMDFFTSINRILGMSYKNDKFPLSVRTSLLSIGRQLITIHHCRPCEWG